MRDLPVRHGDVAYSSYVRGYCVVWLYVFRVFSFGCVCDVLRVRGIVESFHRWGVLQA